MSNNETLDRISLRGCVSLLEKIESDHPAIMTTMKLYKRLINDDMPTEEEWQKNIDDLDLALDRARSPVLDLDLALDLDRVLNMTMDLAS